MPSNQRGGRVTSHGVSEDPDYYEYGGGGVKSCKRYKSIIRSKDKPYDHNTWTREISRPYWLTINDIRELKKGDRFDFARLDTNWGDGLRTAYFNIMKRPEDLLAHNIYTYIHDKGLKGNIWKDGKKYLDDGFQFEVMTKEDPCCTYWEPLDENGYLPEKDGRVQTQMRGETPVGWGGPLIRVSDLMKLPEFYHMDEC